MDSSYLIQFLFCSPLPSVMSAQPNVILKPFILKINGMDMSLILSALSLSCNFKCVFYDICSTKDDKMTLIFTFIF